MSLRRALALAVATALLAGGAWASAGSSDRLAVTRGDRDINSYLGRGFVPASVRAGTARYFVVMKEPSLARMILAARGTDRLDGREQRAAEAQVSASHADAVRAAEDLGGRVFFRYSRLVNGFSADLAPTAAEALADRSDVASVQPVGIVRPSLQTSVPFIGTTEVWDDFGAKGKGTRVAVVDTGIDYTHATFGGPGTVEAYDNNDPEFVEAGTFPTTKVIGGFDFVGETYDVGDLDPNNDTPIPDPDPLDLEGHGTHVSSTCCGTGYQDSLGAGVAPKAKLYSYKVFGPGSTGADVIVAAFERAVDPDQDGNVGDHADVISLSLGADFASVNSPDAIAAELATKLGSIVVAASGNAGNQLSGGFAYITGAPATAPDAISVGASIDEFKSHILEVTAPPAPELPDRGLAVAQDWGGAITTDIIGDVMDARAVVPPADAGGAPSTTDRQLCDTTPPGQPFAGKIALVFKGTTDAGDCDGTEKVFRAQEAGAEAVILWSGFGGLPFGLSPGQFVDQITIPSVMVSTADGEALGSIDSPAAPASYDTGGLEVEISGDQSAFPAFEDRVADFSSEGPARLTGDLKPDILAPGVDIEAALAGSGTGSLKLSGTSMATPHIAGVAALMRELHPKWPPRKIKALIMNQATRSIAGNNGAFPISATIIGAGRVRANQSAAAVSVAWPGSLSFGLNHLKGSESLTRSFKVKNYDDDTLTYNVSVNPRYSDFDPSVAELMLSKNGTNFVDEVAFSLDRHEKKKLWVKMTLDPSVISPEEQEYAWVGFNANVDGAVLVEQTGVHKNDDDAIGVPWHVIPRPASDVSVSPAALDLTTGPASLTVSEGPAAGVSQADFYLLGGEDDLGSHGEEDITHFGARSFTGPRVDDGVAAGVPPGQEPLFGLGYIDFLTADNAPSEPVGFGVRMSAVHNTTETLEVDVFIDAGADGNFADDNFQADFIAAKIGPFVCVFDLSLASPFDGCVAAYFQDYSAFNTNVVGMVVDAEAIGLTNKDDALAYKVEACDLANEFPVCDSAGGIDGSGTYSAVLTTTDPALIVDPWVCGGFFGTDCSSGASVSPRSGNNPSLLVLFPSNVPADTAALVTTTT